VVGWGILGLGGIASRIAPAVGNAEGANLAGVCSRNRGKADAFAAQYGAAEGYDDYDAMLNDPAVDAVYIATPNSLHLEQTLRALETGVHVLVDKPMALTVAEAETMVEGAKTHGLKLGVGFHLRHHPVHIALKRLIEAGEAGEIIFAEAQHCSNWTVSPRYPWHMDPAMAGAGSMMGRGVHCIDLLRWLVGQEIAEVTALADTPIETDPVETLTVAALKFDGGAFGQFMCSRRVPNEANSVSLYGTQQRLEGEDTLSMAASGHLKITRGVDIKLSRLPLRDAYEVEIEAFSRAVAQDEPFEADGIDGLRSVLVTCAILDSARQGCAVSLR
jgi:1,5-anhydro-D-fructose reductase (1,5-anhydro-D-mannitol-forming)